MKNNMQLMPSINPERVNTAVASLKGLLIGVVLTLVILAGIWIKAHYSALVIAAQYPEIVSSLEVTKSFNIKK